MKLLLLFVDGLGDLFGELGIGDGLVIELGLLFVLVELLVMLLLPGLMIFAWLNGNVLLVDPWLLLVDGKKLLLGL